MSEKERNRLLRRIERLKKEFRRNQESVPERVKNALRLLKRVSR